MIHEFSTAKDWQESEIRAFAWHQHTNKCAVAWKDNTIKIFISGRYLFFCFCPWFQGKTLIFLFSSSSLSLFIFMYFSWQYHCPLDACAQYFIAIFVFVSILLLSFPLKLVISQLFYSFTLHKFQLWHLSYCKFPSHRSVWFPYIFLNAGLGTVTVFFWYWFQVFIIQ